MKILIPVLTTALLSFSCKKEETQYIDRENRRESVNNPQSDTIKTLQEKADTLKMNNHYRDVKTDNE